MEIMWLQRRIGIEHKIKKATKIKTLNSKKNLMPVKIKVYTPLLPNYVKEVDFDDFERIDVGIKGEIESNHFLWKLWHLFDLQYAPSNGNGCAPWAYLPQRYIGKKNQVLVLGNINTALGNFQVAISYVTKGDIDSICFYSGIHNDKLTYKKLRELVLQAKDEVNQLETFHYKVELYSHFDKLNFHPYIGQHFKLYTQNEKIYVSFDVTCVDKYEAYHLGMERMKYLAAFLAVETNILFDYPFIETSSMEDMITENQPVFMQNYIDGYSISGDTVLLSEEGFHFLNQYVFVERDLCLTHLVKYFLLGCIHVQDGMKEQEDFDDVVKATFPNLTYAAMRKQVKNRQEKYTHCIMHYLSAIETASFEEGNHETCACCGAVKYKIGARVKDFMTKYFNENLGNIYKGLYNIRSKYLHTGILSTSGDFLNARPLLDIGTDLGLFDASFVSVRANGNVSLVSAMNIKEWTTFGMRSFYHEKMYGNKNFEVEESYNNNSEDYIKHFSDIVFKSKVEGLEITGIEPT